MKLTEFPSLVKEWHYDKNHPLRPENFSYGSGHKKAWWLFPMGHSYERTLNTRTSHSTGCPYCAGS